MRPLHPRSHGEALPIFGISEIGLPIAGPANGPDQPMVAGLKIKEGQRIAARRVSAGRFEDVVLARAEIFLQRFEIQGGGIAAPSMTNDAVSRLKS